MNLTQPKEIVDKVVEILNNKKAIDVEVIYVGDLTYVTDYFVICSGTSTLHVKGIADEVDEKLAEEGIYHFHLEGYDTARWVLLDYGDVVVHIFHKDEREFYNLERLWYRSNGKIDKGSRHLPNPN